MNVLLQDDRGARVRLEGDIEVTYVAVTFESVLTDRGSGASVRLDTYAWQASEEQVVIGVNWMQVQELREAFGAVVKEAS